MIIFVVFGGLSNSSVKQGIPISAITIPYANLSLRMKALVCLSDHFIVSPKECELSRVDR